MRTPPRFDRGHTDDLMTFLTSSPTPYHAVASAAERLEKAGFRQVSETDAWDGSLGGKYVLRGGAIIAWYVPEGADAHTPFRIIGAHTDSPNLRVKPRPDSGAHGWRQVAVEIYGGPLLNSWLDRDLGLARPALPARRNHPPRQRRQTPSPRPSTGHPPRPQRHLRRPEARQAASPPARLGPRRRRPRRRPDRLPGGGGGLPAGEVTGWDLMTHSVEPPAYLGRDKELLAGPRMDNLLSVHAGTAALASVAGSGDALPYIPVLAAFDHEENGSQSDTGADGPLLGGVLERSVFARGGSYEDRARAFAGTVCLSSDTGHAVHPNYAERHDPTHHPRADAGPLLKVNVNNRYATDGSGRAVFAAACEKAGVPFQTFVSNNSMPCGTTIGPITAARHGIRTVDIGVAILSMHSVRELCGAKDPYLLANALVAFLEG